MSEIKTMGSGNHTLYDTDARAKLNEMFTATDDNVGQALVVESVTDGVASFTFGEAGSDITVTTYSASSTYAVGSYCMYEDTIYRSNVPITTAEAFDSTKWDAITVSGLIADMNEKLDMLVTMQEVEEEEAPEGVTQIINPSNLTWNYRSSADSYTVFFSEMIPLYGDGAYYQNPYGVSITTNGKWYLFYTIFYDAYGNQLTLTNSSSGSTITYLTMGGSSTTGWHFEIENGKTLYYYLGSTLVNTYTTTADIAYLGNTGSQTPFFAYFDDTDTQFGLTYGGSSASYVSYDGSSETTYALNYIPAMAQYVEAYMQSQGTAACNNMFNYFYPEESDTDFVNALKYYHERADRKRNNIIRFATFNKFVSRGTGNWSTIKQELADYSIDICGFQECGAVVEDDAVTSQIGAYLQGWQFGGYAEQDTEVNKAIVSHWEVTQTDIITLLTHDSGTSDCIHALMTIPADRWYSNAVDADATLSVYCYHGSSSNKTIGGTSYTSYEIRQMEITALLTVLASDTADFIVIVGDTNAFETGFTISTGTHAEWEMFRSAGFTPVLPGYDSTVTADLADRYFAKADNDKVYCIACYDQIFIGSNITAKGYGVVDSNLYPVESLGGVPVSDHCMVYADLEFDFDAVQQAKLAQIAITEPWW